MVLTNFTCGTSVTTKKKTTKGRKKIEIKKIEETNSRQVTFSKRRTGLFKKASELCVLTGAQIAILVNSPSGRVFSFGHPNADAIVDRYLNNPINNEDTAQNYPQQLHDVPTTKQLNQHYEVVSKELEAEKRPKEMIPGSSNGGLPWYYQPVDGFDVEELEQYLCSLEELKKKVVTRADELMIIKNSNPLFGLNVFDNNIQTVVGPTNTTVQGGGFNFHHFA